MYLNQLERVGSSAIQIATPSSVSVYNEYPITSVAQQYSDQPSNDGSYEFRFRAYAPTQHSSSTHGSDPAASFIVSDISVSISDDISSGSISASIPDDGEIDVRFLPMFSNQFSGDLDIDGLLDGPEQSSSIQITNNSVRPYADASTRRMYLKYNGSSYATTSYTLYYDQISPPASVVSYAPTLSSLIPSGNFGSVPYNLYSRLEQI